MAFGSTIQLDFYITRAVQMLKANTTLINPNPEDSLVTDVLAQQAPIDQSPNKSIIPIIYVYLSRTPIRDSPHFGRDGLNIAGAKYYELEFYNVIIARGIDKQAAQQKCQDIGAIVRDVYQRNLRMLNTTQQDPICANNSVTTVPFVLRSDDPNIQALNVIVRPEVPNSLR